MLTDLTGTIALSPPNIKYGFFQSCYWLIDLSTHTYAYNNPNYMYLPILTFTSFDIEPYFDILEIYSGYSDNSSMLVGSIRPPPAYLYTINGAGPASPMTDDSYTPLTYFPSPLLAPWLPPSMMLPNHIILIKFASDAIGQRYGFTASYTSQLVDISYMHNNGTGIGGASCQAHTTCNNHGQCVNGICQCDEGYYGTSYPHTQT